MGVTRRWSLVTSMYLPSEYHDRCSRYIKVWCMLMKSRVRPGRSRKDPNDKTAYRDDPEKFVRAYLEKEEADAVMNETNKPLVMVIKMYALVASLHSGLPITVHQHLQGLLDEMGAVQGCCERLQSTPMPISYTRHTSRCLGLWLITLPLAMWPVCGLASIPLVLLITYVLLGIDELAAQIEEPFAILPLKPMCDSALYNVDLCFRLGPANLQQSRATPQRDAAPTHTSNNVHPIAPEIAESWLLNFSAALKRPQ
uniref:Bestrophin homolog n=1 Tax=Tetraselmis chuii TaxID=63592 RepID=A0A7S1T7K7_9CHLO